MNRRHGGRVVAIGPSRRPMKKAAIRVTRVSRLSYRDAGAARGEPAPRADQPVLRRPAAIPLMVR